MKFKNFFPAILVAVLFTTQISASVRTTLPIDGTNVNFSTNDKTLKVSVRNVQSETVSIFLDDAEGISLVNETMDSKPNFVKSYRLDNLPAGKYTLTVKRNGLKIVQPFELTPVGISMSGDNKEETLIPSLTQKDDKVFVSSFVKTGGMTTVRIVSNDGIEFFKESYNNEILRKTFDVSKLPSGVYFFELQTKDETEYFTVTR